MEYSKQEYSKIGSIIQQKTRKQINNYKLIDIVGRGSCGAVYLAQLMSAPYTLYAVKTLNKNALKPQICEEISIHRMVGWHPSVVNLEFVIELEDTIYIGLEYCKGGDLYDAITIGNITNCLDDNNNNNNTRDELVRNLFLSILNAVDFCHSRGVYHRDLKPENILLDEKGCIKIADFGLATRSVWSKEYGCGSCFYMSPEAHKPKSNNKNKYSNLFYCTSAADIWSLGVIFLNLCFGRNPWKRASTDDAAFLEYILNPNLLADMFPLSNKAHNLVKRMLCINPLKRITINELIKEVKSIPHFIKRKEENNIINNSNNKVKSNSLEFNINKMKSMDSGISESMNEDYITSFEDSSDMNDKKSSLIEEEDIEMEISNNNINSKTLDQTEKWINQQHHINRLKLNINKSDQSINNYWSCESAAVSPI